MSREISRRPGPSDELEQRRAVLTEVEDLLPERELELATLRSELADFERRYLAIIGIRYATLDRIRADIAEEIVRQNPNEPGAQDQAVQARQQAETSQEATEAAGSPNEPPHSPPSEDLKKLFRQAAKAIHPDRTTDPEERRIRKKVMTDLNRAYADQNHEEVERILREWEHRPEAVRGDGPEAELARTIRKIAQIRRRLQTIQKEIDKLRASELFAIKQHIDQARVRGIDLLAQMACTLDQQIAEAAERLNQLRQSERL
jgi:hypothetical protein